jgi:hypothetical protein
VVAREEVDSIAGVGEAAELGTFDEVLEVLRGLTGKLVEATVFLPGDENGYGVAHVGGPLHSLTERRGGRWELAWTPEGAHPSDITVTLWPGRFQRAELTFTGEAEDSAADVVEETGHNAFLKIWSAGAIVDVIVYV